MNPNPVPNSVPNSASSVSSPIADLTYRNYDGPLLNRSIRWWVVTKALLEPLKKRVAYWLEAGAVFILYLGAGLLLYFTQTLTAGQNLPGQADEHHRFAQTFMNLFNFTGILIFAATLSVGAAAISADTKANALMIYLSKPLTKGDYLLGKWVGTFAGIFFVSFAPALILWLFCLAAYLKDGFLSNEPLLLFRIIGACGAQAAIYASFDSRRVGVVQSPAHRFRCLCRNLLRRRHHHRISLVLQLSSALSRCGEPVSLRWRVRGRHGTVFLRPAEGRRSGRTLLPRRSTDFAPRFFVIVAVATVYIVGGIAAARTKIKAVEVVKG